MVQEMRAPHSGPFVQVAKPLQGKTGPHRETEVSLKNRLHPISKESLGKARALTAEDARFIVETNNAARIPEAPPQEPPQEPTAVEEEEEERWPNAAAEEEEFFDEWWGQGFDEG